MPETQRFRAPRGVADLLPADQPYWRWLQDTAARVAESYGYGQIDTPVFEHEGVFIRPGSEGTDVVDKEIYRFEDRGGDTLALRPEGTAGVCRAFLEHGMSSWPQPVRLFYFISVFRYDRPQAGRYRVHHQFGVENIGEADAGVDAEVIDLLHSFYGALGLTELNLQINSIGDQVCRPAYIEELRAYYADKIDRMCGDCRRRYDVNPLRLLDCKNEPCQPFKAAAPKIVDHLCSPCAEHFATVKALLTTLGIGYSIDPSLVRGLDYYTRTAFEFQPVIEGSQSTIGGGGRYDRLIEQLGGAPTPGIGFGSGIERIILNLKRAGLEPPELLPARRNGGPVDAFIAVADKSVQGDAMGIARKLRLGAPAKPATDDPLSVANEVPRRLEGLPLLPTLSVIAGSGSLRSQMRHANAIGARNAIVIGRRELESGQVVIKALATGSEETVLLSEAASVIARR